MDYSKLVHLKKIINKWPAYRNFIQQKGVDPLKIKNIDELPITSKRFISSAIHSIPLYKVRNIVPSSGSTGTGFSFGIYGDVELAKSSIAIDALLEKQFDTKNKKTLLINLMPGAISLFSSTASIASIGVRIDTAITAIKSFNSYFDQLILIGEPIFIKNLIEQGVRESLCWRYIPMYVVVGGEWISESYRNYLEDIVGYNRVYSSMGMAELGLNYFFETNETIMLRRLIYEDSDFRRLLFNDIDFCPMFFAYNPDAIHLETVSLSHGIFDSVLLTTLDADRILPLIRYMSGDKGRLLDTGEINHALVKAGYPAFFSSDNYKILAHFGRGKNIEDIYPEKIKELIYSSKDLASSITGNFMLTRTDKEIDLNIQLKKGVYLDSHLKDICYQLFYRMSLTTKLFSFETFPNVLDYERKVQYINESNNGNESSREELELSVAV